MALDTAASDILDSDTPAVAEGVAKRSKGGHHAVLKKRLKVTLAGKAVKRMKVSKTRHADCAADSLIDSSTAEARLGQRVSLAKLPRGLPVFGQVQAMPPRWKPGDPLQRPTLLSFRDLLYEQYTNDDLLGRKAPECRPKAEPLEVTLDELASSSAEHSDRGLRTSEPEEDVTSDRSAGSPKAKGTNKESSILERIGKQDHWGEMIRSLENRLERQGIVAAPDTFVRKKAQKKTSRGDDMYYDANDSFIDDSALEEINAAIEAPASSAKTQAKSTSLASRETIVMTQDAVSENTAGSSVDMKLNPSLASFLDGFRLTANEISGTSEESVSDDDEAQLLEMGLLANPWSRDDRGWNYQLSGLRDQLVLVSAGAPLVDDGMERLANEGESLAAICAVLSAFCTAVEAAVATQMTKCEHKQLQPPGRPDLEQFEVALSAVYRKLPPLLRIRRQEPGVQGSTEQCQTKNQRWKLHLLESSLPGQGRNEGSDEAAAETGDDVSKQTEILPWSEAEELAWCCFLWKLTTEPKLAPGIHRRSFIRSWLSATKSSQREVLFKARQDLGITLKDLMTRSRRPIMDAVQNWQDLRNKFDEDTKNKSDDDSEKKSVDGVKLAAAARVVAMRPVIACLRNIQVVWSRQKLWQDQRQASRVKLAFSNQAGRQKEHQAMGLYFSLLLHEYTELKFPLELLTALLRSKQRLAASHATPSATHDPRQSVINERQQFLASLSNDSWVSCRYAGQRREFLGVLYNARIRKVIEHASRDPGSRKFNLEYVGGDLQSGVDIEQIHPPIMWKVGDSAEYRDGYLWYACTIKSMQKHSDPGRVTYSVTDVNDSEVLGVRLGLLRPKLLDFRGTGSKAVKKDGPKQPRGKPKASPNPKVAAQQPKANKHFVLGDKVCVPRRGRQHIGKVVKLDDDAISVQCEKEVIRCPAENVTLVSSKYAPAPAEGSKQPLVIVV
eukprot:TRINITY_DN103482_c0_g1_i1.p1 TRINITY_DN103482_c0_g1~~TRINITY_DN103482_c0_g1_i1.p1  ORF type:complete len:953 (-),score=161.19 TRINITY_DN103482_c0_g1_i1:19-2877(-)